MVDRLGIIKELKGHLILGMQLSIIDVILFGSQANENSNDSSDFDVLVILDSDYTWKDESTLLNLCYDIDLKHNIIIDAHLLSKKELTTPRGKQPVYINALNSGIYA